MNWNRQPLPVTILSLFGSKTDGRLTEVSQLVESLVPKIVKAMKLDSAEPLVKGNISMFVFNKRYDFSEFGKMVESRDFPKEISGHWGSIPSTHTQRSC